MIRTTDYVRGYFDGEGCISLATHARGLRIVVASYDLDVISDLAETLRSWGVQTTHQVYPPRAGRSKALGQIYVRDKGVAPFLQRVRPLSAKHEGRLADALRIIDGSEYARCGSSGAAPPTTASIEYVRGYFDAEGCVFIRTRPCRDGMRIGLAVETADQDVLHEIAQTMGTWGFPVRLKTTRTRAPSRKQKWRIDIKRRAAIESVFSRVRPLSLKNEARLTPVLAYWSHRDEHRGRLRSAAALVAAGRTYVAAASEAGVTFSQLSNFLYYERHRGRRPRIWSDIGAPTRFSERER